MKKSDLDINNIEEQAVIDLVSKNDLTSAVVNGMATVEIRKGEKRRFLGEFRERLLKVLTKEQLADKWVYPDIIKAIKDQRSSKVIVKGDYRKQAEKYTYYAKKYNRSVTISNNPEYIGDIVLVVASNDAVDVENISVGEQTSLWRQKGLPEEIIRAGSGKLCRRHYQQLREIISEEVLFFQEINFLDKLAGEKCVACEQKIKQDSINKLGID